MDRRAYERMEQEVRAIHRALTGEDPCLDDMVTDADAPLPAEDEIERRFTSLAIDARSIGSIAAELSTVGFAPAVDVVENGDEVLVEVLLPGIATQDVEVHVAGRSVFLSGASDVDAEGSGRVYLHAEIPRGLFRRVVSLPCDVSSRSRVESDRGVVRIHLQKSRPASADVQAEE